LLAFHRLVERRRTRSTSRRKLFGAERFGRLVRAPGYDALTVWSSFLCVILRFLAVRHAVGPVRRGGRRGSPGATANAPRPKRTSAAPKSDMTTRSSGRAAVSRLVPWDPASLLHLEMSVGGTEQSNQIPSVQHPPFRTSDKPWAPR
jgi:hypothetical protein